MSRQRLSTIAIALTLAGLAAGGPSLAQNSVKGPTFASSKRRLDVSKGGIESPIEGVLRSSTQPTPSFSLTPMLQMFSTPRSESVAQRVPAPETHMNNVEVSKTDAPPLIVADTAEKQAKSFGGPKSAVGLRAASNRSNKTVGSTQKPVVKPQSEKVEPGKVRWHKAIQVALEQSRKSGKPVLLFQMMGHLDDRFC